ncbi:Hypothetical protein NTJ_05464 [Nesidiocoris tenuis]|uniref:Uncharacterized protein n=1 Tax=Nesidiocoris tenuis TaxID=355587 RepID=A0ABN7AP19_9HEMI|nr:Hypothetical protein NTJ_05464 [Nesidiocoris tenuis]
MGFRLRVPVCELAEGTRAILYGIKGCSIKLDRLMCRMSESFPLPYRSYALIRSSDRKRLVFESTTVYWNRFLAALGVFTVIYFLQRTALFDLFF